MLGIFKKLFCCHDWVVHSKKEYEWTEKELIPETRHWVYPEWRIKTYSETTEVLICKKCGKIRIITY